jgi:hypothetical protein
MEGGGLAWVWPGLAFGWCDTVVFKNLRIIAETNSYVENILECTTRMGVCTWECSCSGLGSRMKFYYGKESFVAGQ